MPSTAVAPAHFGRACARPRSATALGESSGIIFGAPHDGHAGARDGRRIAWTVVEV